MKRERVAASTEGNIRVFSFDHAPSFSKKEELAEEISDLKKNKGGERVILPGKCARTWERLARGSTSLFLKRLKKRGKKRSPKSSSLRRTQRCDLKAHTPYIRRAVVMDEGHTRMMAVVRARGVPPDIPPSQISPSKMPTAYLLVPPRRGRRGPPVLLAARKWFSNGRAERATGANKHMNTNDFP